MPNVPPANSIPPDVQLLTAFRDNYRVLEGKVITTLRESAGDAVVIARVGDQLDNFLAPLKQVCRFFAKY